MSARAYPENALPRCERERRYDLVRRHHPELPDDIGDLLAELVDTCDALDAERNEAAAEDLALNEREEQRIEDWQNREREIGESLRRSRGFVTLRTVRDLALVSLLTLCAWACIIVLCGMSEVAR